MTLHNEQLEAHVRAVMAWELRIALHVSKRERLIERVFPVERWEWKTPDGRWARYWRRDGSLPA